jgi:hypothetical protein
METYVIKTKVTKDGKIAIKLPFRPNQKVEVIVRELEKTESPNPYPLRGLPYRYDKPFESAAEDDWDVLK